MIDILLKKIEMKEDDILRDLYLETLLKKLGKYSHGQSKFDTDTMLFIAEICTSMGL